MIRLIETNVANFGNFKDIMLYMRDENMKEIEIKSIRLWDGGYLHKGLCGLLTYEEIKRVVEEEV